MYRVSVVEDDENIREIVLYALQSAGFRAVGFESAGAFFATLGQEAPDLLLLDIMLPGEDGLGLLRRLRTDARAKALPVILLTAKGSEFDKVKGLDLGADDYITKPFGVMELISRVNAVLRRSGTGPVRELTLGGLTLDHERREVLVGGQRVNLTFKEYELLRYLALNAERALSRDRILGAVWGYDFEGESRTLDMHIRSLRQKLGDAGAYIQTVRNVGYKLEART
jgi:two-component system alkaline phosphatase synthesis response regulator PhoP